MSKNKLLNTVLRKGKAKKNTLISAAVLKRHGTLHVARNQQRSVRRVEPRFDLGRVETQLATQEKLPTHQVVHALMRHSFGDWGKIDAFERRQNKIALKAGESVKSIFHLSKSLKITVITSGDRRLTKVTLKH